MQNGSWRDGDWRRLVSWGIAAALLLLVVLSAGRAILADAHAPVRLIVYAFSTQEEVLSQAIIPAFEKSWEAETGRDLRIEAVFGPSGTLAGQINLGAPADVALLSNAQHVTWLKVGRRVNGRTTGATIAETPIVIVTRPSNPAGITGYADLARPGLRLLHADPHSSGGGAWAVLAEYGSALAAGPQQGLSSSDGDRAAAEAQLKAIWRNVRVMVASARAAMTLFELGTGDALVTYEQDARLALERGVPLEVIVPAGTIIAEHVAVVVDDNVTAREREAAQAFLDYLLSNAGQEILARYHLRPAEHAVAGLPALVRPFTVNDLGGWSNAYNELVESLWKKQIEPYLDLELVPSRPEPED